MLGVGVQIARPDAVCVAHVEREAGPAAILVARMEQGVLAAAPIWSDVGTFDGRPWRGVVDCLISGDPCQPNSNAGKRLGSDDDRWLLDQVIRIIDECRPARIFRENVTGNAGGQLAVFVPALEQMGYRVASGVFSAVEVGASHQRERLFILADRDGENVQGRRPNSYPIGWQEPAGYAGLCSGTVEAAFAPGPDDQRWQSIVEQRPDLAPATQRKVRGMVDGLPSRVDQLRAIGNGVVPLAVAHAWLSLDALLATIPNETSVSEAA